MKPGSTLTELLETSGFQPSYFDMGRRVNPIDRAAFLDFECTRSPYPLPLQQQAWFAVLLAEPDNPQGEVSIWFLHLPLDEQCKLQQAVRDDLLQRLLEVTGRNLQAAEKGEQLQAALQDNPYAFTPKQERLAVFHAKVNRLLNRPPSRFYAHARSYFCGEIGWDQWPFLGYQGIADLGARFDLEDTSQQLAAAIPQLPGAPLEALCHCLENERVTDEIATALLERMESALNEEEIDLQLITAAIRGSSQARSPEIRQRLIERVLQAPCATHSEILAAIAGRAWEGLQETAICRLFLERLAENQEGQALFNQLLSDLMFLPDTRPQVLAGVRDPARSEQLSRAFGALLQGVQTTP